CGVLRGLVQELVACRHERLMAGAPTVLKVEIETRGITQFHDGRRSEGDDHSVSILRERRVGTAHHGEDILPFPTALFPRFHLYEKRSRALAPSGEVKAIDGHHALHAVAFLG